MRPPPDTSRPHACPVCRAEGAAPGLCPDCFVDNLLSAPGVEPGAGEDDPARGEGEDSLVLGGRFRVGEFLARGGTGSLYEGVDLETGLPVALKIPRDIAHGSEEREEGRQRFLAEAETLSRLQLLQHPNIAILLASGVDGEGADATPFLALKREPDTLQSWVRRRPEPLALPPRRVLTWLIELSAALSAAHGLGILHRDVKPSNILLDTEHHTRLTDWSLTGTDGYLPPETVNEHKEPGVQGDIFALGVVMHQLVTGNMPFQDTPPLTRCPGVPRSFLRIYRRATAFDPRDRYATAAAFQADLERARHQLDHPPFHHRKSFRAAAAVFALAAAVAVPVYLLRHSPTRPSAPAEVLARTAPVFPPHPISGSSAADWKPVADLTAAAAGKPWENTLGQWFAPLPAGPGRYLSCTETRIRDFSAFMREWPALAASAPPELTAASVDRLTGPDVTRERNFASWWETAPGLTPDHPVSGVSWHRAAAFCWWLTRKEQAAGRIPATAVYRLPTMEEWAAAWLSPAEIRFPAPWGTEPLPPAGYANLLGPEALGTLSEPSKWDFLSFADPFPAGAPVASFPADAGGFFDLTGNLQEWTATTFRTPAGTRHALLGGASWCNALAPQFRSDSPVNDHCGVRTTTRGFRPLLDLGPPPGEPYLELTLHRVSDLTGAPHTAEPGAPLSSVPLGRPFRLTFLVRNWGAVSAGATTVMANLRTPRLDKPGSFETIYRSPTATSPEKGGAIAVTRPVPAAPSPGEPGRAWFSFEMDTASPAAAWRPGVHDCSATVKQTPGGPVLDTTAPGPALPLHRAFWWVTAVLDLH